MEKMAFNDEVRELLSACSLPVDDLDGNSEINLFAIRHEGVLSGVVGVESRGKVGLFRSLAIRDTYRGEGLGRKLVADGEAWAASNGLKALYLLTLTADEFFQRLGYVKLHRSDAPSAISETREFMELCPVSSVFMCKHLGANNSSNPTGYSASAPKPAG